MKRILAIILSIVLLLSLCACGNNKKAEKYCSSCGEGISKDVSFCEHCGAAVNNEKTESEDNSSDNSSSTESKTEETSKPSSATESTSKPTESSKPATNTTSTNKPSTPTHTHSYSKKVTAATCTEKGYTTYTCSCGDTYKDNYTDPTHTYSKYKCTKCGTVDKNNTYNYLKEWLLKNGETKGSRIGIYTNFKAVGIDNVDGELYVEYEANSDKIYFSTLTQTSSTELRQAMVVLENKKDYEYTYITCINTRTNGNTHEIAGVIKAPNYTTNGPLSYRNYNGPSSDESRYSETSRALVAVAVIGFSNFLILEVPEINIHDFGFTSYK